jgi:uncharacterized protein YecT (DUF1311 family)
MRLMIVTLVVLGVATGPTVAAAAGGPPVIHEPFTKLGCPAHPVSTVELEGCAEKTLLASNRQVDAAASRIFRLLRSTAARSSFARGEQAWLQYRRASCSAEASKYAGGTAEPLLYLQCETRRNKAHLTDLVQMERTLRRG